MSKCKVVATFRQGNVVANVQKNMIDSQSVYSVKVTRPYTNKHGKVKFTTTLRPDDCTDAAHLLTVANEYMLTAP